MPVGYPLDPLGYHKPGQDLVMIHYTRSDTGQEPHYEVISYLREQPEMVRVIHGDKNEPRL